jgi:hypothetical protein
MWFKLQRGFAGLIDFCYGSTSPIRLTRKRTTVENYLQQVQNNVGCFVLDLSYFKLRQIEAGEGNVV